MVESDCDSDVSEVLPFLSKVQKVTVTKENQSCNMTSTCTGPDVSDAVEENKDGQNVEHTIFNCQYDVYMRRILLRKSLRLFLPMPSCHL